MFLHNRASLSLSLLFLLVVKEEEVGVSSSSFSVAKPEIERFLPDPSPKSRNRGEGRGGPRAAEKIIHARATAPTAAGTTDMPCPACAAPLALGLPALSKTGNLCQKP